MDTPGDSELLDETGERLAEILQRGFLGLALPMRADARPQLGVRAPHAVLVALDNDRDGNDA